MVKPKFRRPEASPFDPEKHAYLVDVGKATDYQPRYFASRIVPLFQIKIWRDVVTKQYFMTQQDGQNILTKIAAMRGSEKSVPRGTLKAIGGARWTNQHKRRNKARAEAKENVPSRFVAPVAEDTHDSATTIVVTESMLLRLIKQGIPLRIEVE